MSWSLDHVGPLARTVVDTWLVFHAMAGQPLVGPLAPAERRRLDTVTLGVLRPYFCDLLDDGVRTAFESELERLRRQGVRTIEVSVPHADEIASIYLHIQLPEASAYHATAVETRPGAYTPPVRLRLELGRYVLAEDYVRAVRGQRVLCAEVDRALAECDALVLPTLPIPPQPLGATTVTVGGGPEPVRGLMLRETQLFDLSGHPAITMPCGRTASGLPCGLQLVGRRGKTAGLVLLAYACEARADRH